MHAVNTNIFLQVPSLLISSCRSYLRSKEIQTGEVVDGFSCGGECS
ncbi:hypothetical protein POPTR_001G007232v4 [Populus trichocarpa]|uniref:Uncharacterized protein n=1 Tax=Populus trichocarpa TaxID=3694 RepID=A0ACC0TGM6_POPTR|nr:hypothetical protein BDE02_01G007200 [Populus trichocarpa]KAI9400593.1 hypothetical protein POPTR_001G007232v4 [Populus trichocarpa]